MPSDLWFSVSKWNVPLLGSDGFQKAGGLVEVGRLKFPTDNLYKFLGLFSGLVVFVFLFSFLAFYMVSMPIIKGYSNDIFFLSRVRAVTDRLSCLESKGASCNYPRPSWVNKSLSTIDEVKLLKSFERSWKSDRAVENAEKDKRNFEIIRDIEKSIGSGWYVLIGLLVFFMVMFSYGMLKWKDRQKIEDQLLELELKIKELEFRRKTSGEDVSA